MKIQGLKFLLPTLSGHDASLIDERVYTLTLSVAAYKEQQANLVEAERTINDYIRSLTTWLRKRAAEANKIERATATKLGDIFKCYTVDVDWTDDGFYTPYIITQYRVKGALTHDNGMPRNIGTLNEAKQVSKELTRPKKKPVPCETFKTELAALMKKHGVSA